MCPEMGFEMRALGVGLPAAAVGAGVRRCPLPGPGTPAPLGFTIQKLEGRGGRCQHGPRRRAGLQADRVVEEAVLVGVVQLVAREGVAGLVGQAGRAHQLALVSLGVHQVAGAERRSDAAPAAAAVRWAAQSLLLLVVRHHARHGVLLFDPETSRPWHHAHGLPVAPHARLNFGNLGRRFSREDLSEDEATLDGVGLAVLRGGIGAQQFVHQAAGWEAHGAELVLWDV